MKTQIVKFANPNEGFSAAQMLQSGRNFIVRTPQKPYNVNEDISQLLFKNFPTEYYKQLALKQIPVYKNNLLPTNIEARQIK